MAEYVTLRKHAFSSTTNDISNTSIFESTTRSLPNTSLDEENGDVIALSKRVEELTNELLGAHQEIDDLMLENQNLKTDLEKSNKLISTYKKIATECATPIEGKKRRNHTAQSTLQKLRLVMNNHPSPTKSQIDTDKIPISVAHSDTLQNDSTDDSAAPTIITLDCADSQSAAPMPETSNTLRKNLCIISSNKTNRILQTAQDTFSADYDLCHYLITGAGITQLVERLPQKLQHFGSNDVCVIMVGEEDFIVTKNYVTSVMAIREATKSLQQHTNVVICVPTFRCGRYTEMYNRRVESFNNLLYLDALTHEHVYVFDSNLNLSYDYGNMFSGIQGKLNRKGMQTLFYNLKADIQELNLYLTSKKPSTISVTENNSPSTPSEENDDLFRV